LLLCPSLRTTGGGGGVAVLGAASNFAHGRDGCRHGVELRAWRSGASGADELGVSTELSFRRMEEQGIERGSVGHRAWHLASGACG
jgi:hypothetical protein